MTERPVQAELLSIGEVFQDASYQVPIYQRNYSWSEEEIGQLIDDIWSAARDAGAEVDDAATYFLGNLVVAERPDGTTQTELRHFDVIDGQQRLTTLSLLLEALDTQADPHRPGPYLLYASRPGAAAALANPGSPDGGGGPAASVHTAFRIIQQSLATHLGKDDNGTARQAFATFLLQRVRLVRATLDASTDLNRYFEIMNTRGQQLEQVDIVKARLMRLLGDEPDDQNCFAWIWDACADMDTYVQMSLTRVARAVDPVSLRRQIFGPSYDTLQGHDFATLNTFLQRFRGEGVVVVGSHEDGGLEEALVAYARAPEPSAAADGEGSDRFRSPIIFASFLLHVLKVLDTGPSADDDTDDGGLDDNKLIVLFDKRFGSQTDHTGSRDAVKRFAETLLRCRFVFDNFVLKREYTGRNGDDGDWSLRRLTQGTKPSSVTYQNAFAGTEASEEDHALHRRALLLQSMLRITYTSPRTMHWITAVLRMPELDRDGSTSGAAVVSRLEDFARARVRAAYFAGKTPSGFAIERIVFTYLDYLLLQRDSRTGYRFTFRNSVEHFFPQQPDRDQADDVELPQGLNSLGNLALISVGANSKFSNNTPRRKSDFIRLIAQSPKLQLMAQHAETWDDEAIDAHCREMERLLGEDVANAPPPDHHLGAVSQPGSGDQGTAT
ncbi:DUF262 domain-containing protein [Aquipuribacter hungaricus]|uniref:DUF262 domain-containing protein n=1 Tax=Aquipuribacter hungaricus TaxID=545624 RepID=A0ABV7WJ63_9MICO